MKNVTFVDTKGNRFAAVVIETHPDASVTLTYQSGGIHTQKAVKNSSGEYEAAKEEA